MSACERRRRASKEGLCHRYPLCAELYGRAPRGSGWNAFELSGQGGGVTHNVYCANCHQIYDTLPRRMEGKELLDALLERGARTLHARLWLPQARTRAGAGGRASASSGDRDSAVKLEIVVLG